ncbi:MAG: HD domain-containing protein [Brevefilum sp.]|nr:HD domain-containing protein [Brevefilum sp.]
MRLKFSPALEQLLDLILAELPDDQALYIVGGAIRDILLGRPLHDLDFVMPDDPTSLAKKIAHKLQVGFFVLDDERHTARVLFRRQENQIFPLDFIQFTGEDLHSDLMHRDFTINAISVSVRETGKLIDPLDGIKDLAAGLLRTCSDHALTDDPVRVLRGIRLAMQFNLSYAPGLPELMTEASQFLPRTSAERQRDELFKILEGPDPAEGMAHCHQFGVFTSLIPSLMEQEDIPSSPPHTLRLFDHSLKVLEYLKQLIESPEDLYTWWLLDFRSTIERFSENIVDYLDEEITPGRSKKGLLMFAALLHDVGKPETFTVGEDGYLHFYNHAKIGADLAWKAAKALQFSNAESEWIHTIVQNHMHLLPFGNRDRKPSRVDVYRFYQETGGAGAAVALLSLADTLATYNQNLTPEKWQNALMVSEVMLSAWWEAYQSVVSPTLLLDGNDLQEEFGMAPGKEIGEILEKLREAQAAGEVTTREQAAAFIQSQIKGIE